MTGCEAETTANDPRIPDEVMLTWGTTRVVDDTHRALTTDDVAGLLEWARG